MLHPVPVFRVRTLRFRLALLLLPAALLSGCASLTHEQCLRGDWRQIGHADGSAGASAYLINDHAKACAEVGVRPNLDEYLRGREQGFELYCRPQNAFAIGRSGAAHNADECPESMKPAFYTEYERGHQVYLVESELAQRRARIDHNYWQMRRDDERIFAIRSELAKGDLPAERRNGLLNEYNRLVDRKDFLGRENGLLQLEAERLQFQLNMRLREFGH